ncbi:MAG: phosphate ABC transporter ATP-binding protein [Acidobacteriota bacterium]
MSEIRSRPKLVIENLSVRYGARWAFRDVSFEIPDGGLTALVGPSGCGKSSLLHCLDRLTDLIPGARVDGSIRLDDEEVLGPKVDVLALRRRIGLISQAPNPFAASLRKNVEMPLTEHGMKDPQERQDVLERVLREVGLWDEVADRLDVDALSLSGGQQQRLCIARALALQPEVLLLDEPCSALDPLARGVVEDLLTALAERMSLVVVTHDLAQARRLADELAVFWWRGGAGCLVASGPAERVFVDPADPDAAAYLRGERS